MLRLGLRPWLWLVALLLMLFVVQQSSFGKQLGPRLNLFFAPLLSELQEPGDWWMGASQWFIERHQLQAELLDSRKRIQRQAYVRQDRDALRAENAQLRSLLGLQGLTDFNWRAAKVLGRSPDKMNQRLILRTEVKIHSNDVVASSEGLVGLVDTVSGHRAVVRTILDASLAVPVTLPGSSLAALVRGQGKRLAVEFVPQDHVPPRGSVLFTSGAGGMFPPGIPVARILRIRTVPGSVFADVEAEPEAHWRRDAWLSIAMHKQP